MLLFSGDPNRLLSTPPYRGPLVHYGPSLDVDARRASTLPVWEGMGDGAAAITMRLPAAERKRAENAAAAAGMSVTPDARQALFAYADEHNLRLEHDPRRRAQLAADHGGLGSEEDRTTARISAHEEPQLAGPPHRRASRAGPSSPESAAPSAAREGIPDRGG